MGAGRDREKVLRRLEVRETGGRGGRDRNTLGRGRGILSLSPVVPETSDRPSVLTTRVDTGSPAASPTALAARRSRARAKSISRSAPPRSRGSLARVAPEDVVRRVARRTGEDGLSHRRPPPPSRLPSAGPVRACRQRALAGRSRERSHSVVVFEDVQQRQLRAVAVRVFTQVVEDVARGVRDPVLAAVTSTVRVRRARRQRHVSATLEPADRRTTLAGRGHDRRRG